MIEENIEENKEENKEENENKEEIIEKVIEVSKKESVDENKDELWKHFFTYPRKIYNQYILKMTEYPQYIIFDKEKMSENKEKWNIHFGNDNPLYLEIGSGSGNFTNGLSERHKDRNYIALELRYKRLVFSAKKAERRDAKNILFLRRYGEEMQTFIKEDSLSGVYINFPDPWEEKLKNRVIQPSLFDLLTPLLKKDGIIFIKTDHDGYYGDIINFIGEMEGYEVVYSTPDLHNDKKAEGNIKTEFEQLFLCKHNKNINYIEILKTK